ncbi:hypothetical protein UPYG_G00217000 [Umbra pygmaea]|uniref:Polyamine-modulated factor 1 n=1 Tax=Umbra pygmaea TaxID=75934 RepID=A0ABD0XBF6_UMBPY
MEEAVGTHKCIVDTGENVNNATEGVSSQSVAPENDFIRSDEHKRNRLQLFNKVIEKSLEKFISDAGFQRFAHTFHPFYKKNPEMTEDIHKQFIEHLQRNIQVEINDLIEEGALECKLDELDKLDAAEKSQDPAWRPSGVPDQDLCSFVMPYYLKQQVYLKRELDNIRKENAALAQRVLAGRARIEQTELRIATAVDEWKASAQACFVEFQTISSPFCPEETLDD